MLALFLVLSGWIGYGKYKRNQLAAAYNVPLRGAPYPPLSIPAVDNRAEYQHLIGDINGVGSYETGTVDPAAFFLFGDDYIKRVLLPSLKLQRFSLTVNPSDGSPQQKLYFCGAKRETGITDSHSVMQIDNKFIQVVYTNAQLNGVPCKALVQLDDLTPQLQFQGFVGRSAEMMMTYVEEIDSFYQSSLRDGKWGATRLSQCGDQRCYRILYKPLVNETRSWFAWEVNLTIGRLDPLSDYAKTIETELRRKHKL